MGFPTAEFPIYDGVSSDRPDSEITRAPSAKDFDQVNSELLAHQSVLFPGIASFSMTATAGASTVTEVTIRPLDIHGAVIAAAVVFDIFLSDSAAGVGLTATTASGAVAAKAASGADFGILTAKKALRVQTLANGTYILSITDTAKTAFKVCAVVPASGKPVVGMTLATANYGA